jgi:hypothetical protein
MKNLLKVCYLSFSLLSFVGSSLAYPVNVNNSDGTECKENEASTSNDNSGSYNDAFHMESDFNSQQEQSSYPSSFVHMDSFSQLEQSTDTDQGSNLSGHSSGLSAYDQSQQDLVHDVFEPSVVEIQGSYPMRGPQWTPAINPGQSHSESEINPNRYRSCCFTWCCCQPKIGNDNFNY